MDTTDTLDDLFSVARRHESALNVALRARDSTTANVASAQLRETLEQIPLLIDKVAGEDAALRNALTSAFASSTQTMNVLLEFPEICIAPEPGRAQRWRHARRTTPVQRNGPHIFELDAAGHPLRDIVFFGLHVANSMFFTDLTQATFWEAFIEASDFNYSRLARSEWKDTCVKRSFFRDSCFRNAVFRGTAFFDSDFTNVDFSTTNDYRSIPGESVQFIRCNLTGTLWQNRNLSSVDFFGCRGLEVDVAPQGSRGPDRFA